MARATSMIRFVLFPLGNAGEETLLKLECHYYFGSDENTDPTRFEVCSAYLPDGSEYDVAKLQDPELLTQINEVFLEEYASEIDWDHAGEAPQ